MYKLVLIKILLFIYRQHGINCDYCIFRNSIIKGFNKSPKLYFLNSLNYIKKTK